MTEASRLADEAKKNLRAITSSCLYRDSLDRDMVGDLGAKIDAAIDRLAALSQERGDEARWQPMDTAPRDGSPFLVWMPEPMLSSNVHAATYHPNVACIGGVFAFDAPSQPTRWMPIPDAPDAALAASTPQGQEKPR